MWGRGSDTSAAAPSERRSSRPSSFVSASTGAVHTTLAPRRLRNCARRPQAAERYGRAEGARWKRTPTAAFPPYGSAAASSRRLHRRAPDSTAVSDGRAGAGAYVWQEREYTHSRKLRLHPYEERSGAPAEAITRFLRCRKCCSHPPGRADPGCPPWRAAIPRCVRASEHRTGAVSRTVSRFCYACFRKYIT